MTMIMRRNPTAFETVEIPEGTVPCGSCGGKGHLSAYDRGWRSLAHDPSFAALEACLSCGGDGYVTEEYHELMWGPSDA